MCHLTLAILAPCSWLASQSTPKTVSRGIPELWDFAILLNPTISSIVTCVKLAIQFGSLSDDVFITLVSSHFANLTMEDAPNPPLELTEEMIAELGMDVDSDDEELLDMPSPDTLARERELELHPVLGPLVTDAPRVVPVTPPAPAAAVVQTPYVAGPSVDAPHVTLEKEERKEILLYMKNISRQDSILFDGVHTSDKESVQEVWRHVKNAVNANCALSQVNTNMARMMYLQAYLSGRPLNLFIRKVGEWEEERSLELVKPVIDPKFRCSLPPYPEMCAAIEREFLAGTRASSVELTHKIVHFKLTKQAEKYTDGLPSLAQCWQDFKALLRERSALVPGKGEFDSCTMVWLYLNTLPSNMYDIVRHVKDAQGQVKEPDDPVMLENSILALGDQFLLELKQKREIRAGKQPIVASNRPSGSGAGPSNINDKKRGFQASFGSQKAKQPNKQGKKPFRPSNTFWNYNNSKTQAFWLRDYDLVKDRKGRCLLCDSKDHILTSCPKREQAFRDKAFYAYDRPKPRA